MASIVNAPPGEGVVAAKGPAGSGWTSRAAHVVVIVALLAVPLVSTPQWQAIAVFAAVSAIAALGLHVLTGLAGQVSLGHSAFVAAGGYTAIWLGADKGLPIWLWLPAAGLVSAAVGLLVVPFAARLRGLYLAVVTLAVLFVAEYLWDLWDGVTGGTKGRAAQPVVLFGHDLLDDVIAGPFMLTGDQQFFYLACAVLAVAAVAARNLARTRPGRGFAAIRDRDLTAGVVGVPVARMKSAAFAVAAGYAGIAGALLVSYQTYAVPDQWDLMLSVEYLAMIVIGGVGSLRGAIAGAVFVTAIPQVVTLIAKVVPGISTTPSAGGGVSVDVLANCLYGLAIVAVLVFEPRGLAGISERVVAAARRKGRSHA
ncbi:branched-chain amino acid ABC transporter permease [Actinomadura chibensis]|uniref:Branched-chain amino acid ABC transporter permease n=1 Tax=Actinomadura chibensis TaxID=392828 RepID=A0A5D0NMV1_9ACTN|nr:branched-chain amino acid ABC transporter permease [Actinomadura chibensis]TYB45454.1 branched-chain amino acid ABC transporter permease [Actinomadura chibensis]